MTLQRDPARGMRDPLAALDFSSLVQGAASLRPARIAIHDVSNSGGSPRALTFAALDKRVAAMALALREFGLANGERILIVAGASSASVAAMFGALRAGLDVALAPPHLDASDLAAFASDSGAAAIAGEPVAAGIDMSDAIFSAAAKCERVRLVASLGGGAMDGAVMLDPREDADEPPARTLTDASASHSLVITRDIDGRCHYHRQRTLVAAALDFITRAQIGATAPILSTILPASFAGLAAGPIAALAAGAPMVLHAPFEANAFAELLEALGPVHLVAPMMLTEEFAAAGLIEPRALATLALLTRYKQMPAEVRPEPHGGLLTGGVPVIDIYGIGEIAAISEPRTPEGMRTLPLASQHMLNLDGRDVLAARRKLHYLSANGRLDTVVAIEGAAVSQYGDSDD